jgi:hypothetical protein
MKRQHKTFSSSGKDCNQISGMSQKGTLGRQSENAQQRGLTSNTKDSKTTLGNILCLNITK